MSSGTVVFGDFTERALVGKLLGLSSAEREPLLLANAPTYWGPGEASPTSRWLAYDQPSGDEPEQIAIIDADGDLRSKVALDEGWRTFDWIDDARLAITYGDAPDIRTHVVNPFTGDSQTLAPDLPSFWVPDEPIVVRLFTWLVVYDPSLTLVAYMRGENTGQSLVLWDLEQSRELWHLENWTARTVRPDWSPDGSTLAVAATSPDESEGLGFELYLVNREGGAEKRIDLNDYYLTSDVAEISWSPDGRHIAIIPFSEGPLLILDTLAGQVYDYCIEASGQYDTHTLWSPDGTQAIVPWWDHPSVFVDLVDKVAARITIDDNLRPVAWLTEP
jgi:WD40 repeat protein